MAFGDFQQLCRDVPSYPWCNLFYRQLQKTAPTTLAPPASAPVGIAAKCGIPRLAAPHDLGNIANVVVCGLAFFVVLFLISVAVRRKAAVARVELLFFLTLYLVSLPLQLISTSSFLAQGSTALVAITAVHAGVVAALFWCLLGNALISMQVVEDGTLSSLIPFGFFTAAFFTVTTYISLDVALTLTSTFGPSNPPAALHSIPLFVFTSVWPGAAALLYFGMMAYVVLGVLREVRPLWYYILAAVLFILSQLDYFLLSEVICTGSHAKVDGAFVATILETAAVGVLVMAWRSITEESWDDDMGYYGT
ncbi:chitin synthase III catalytic subunit [Gautieria morchelliformis]|nr:chitin synthase III catalytic subunit [Gautieria morchelliformis]